MGLGCMGSFLPTGPGLCHGAGLCGLLASYHLSISKEHTSGPWVVKIGNKWGPAWQKQAVIWVLGGKNGQGVGSWGVKHSSCIRVLQNLCPTGIIHSLCSLCIMYDFVLNLRTPENC